MTIVNTIQKPVNQHFVILENIPLKLDIDRIMNRLRFSPASHYSRTHVQDLSDKLISRIQPHAFYQESRTVIKKDGGLEINGVLFSYPILRFNLDKASLVFPFCLTLGENSDNSGELVEDPKEKYCLDVIKERVEETAFAWLQNHLAQQYHLPYLWSLVTGEIDAWPPAGRPELLELLGAPAEAIGVKLLPDFSISPPSSQIGFFYYAETEFEGCQVCAKEPCMMRRAQFNAELAAQKGLKIRKVCGKDTA